MGVVVSQLITDFGRTTNLASSANYAAKAENGMRTPLPADSGGVTVTEAMIAVTDILHALNTQLFELSMWQAMTGNCIAPHQRVDAPQS